MSVYDGIDLFLLDLDGTVYVGDRLVDGAGEKLAELKKAGKKLCFLTNNSSKTKLEYLKKLSALGLSVTEEELYTSTQSTYEYVLREHSAKKVYLLATDGVISDFKESGVKVVSDIDSADIAVLAFDTSMTYDKLNMFCRLLQREGVLYVATHADLNCPHPISPMPDVGSFIELIYAATGRRPDVICGKPYQACSDGVMNKYKIDDKRIAMVGDRLYTDIRFGNRFDFLSVLTLTGETTAEMLEGEEEDTPDIVLPSIKDIEL